MFGSRMPAIVTRIGGHGNRRPDDDRLLPGWEATLVAGGPEDAARKVWRPDAQRARSPPWLPPGRPRRHPGECSPE
ncbi:MAG: hypothetical protein ACRCZD_16970 [Phycicoccus sp.]